MPRSLQTLAFKGREHRLGTVVVEAHAIEGGLLIGEAKQTGTWVTGLAMPGDGAHLGKPEAETIPDPRRHTVFVKASRQADGIGKAAAEQHLLQTQIAALQIGRHPLQHRGDTRPAAAQAGLAEGRQSSPRQLLSIQPIVTGQHWPQPTLVEGTAAERSSRVGRGHALRQVCSDPASLRFSLQRSLPRGSTSQSRQRHGSVRDSSCRRGCSTSWASSISDRL